MSDAAPKRRRKTATPHDDVARRAYEKYAARGFTHGQEGDDWLQAEKELEAERTAQPRRSRAKKRR